MCIVKYQYNSKIQFDFDSSKVFNWNWFEFSKTQQCMWWIAYEYDVCEIEWKCK